jgi:hypothetical protein
MAPLKQWNLNILAPEESRGSTRHSARFRPLLDRLIHGGKPRFCPAENAVAPKVRPRADRTDPAYGEGVAKALGIPVQELAGVR